MARTDDFPMKVKANLSKRVNLHCSNPSCDRPTSGPASDSNDGTVSIGVAAHITAASAGGPRFDPAMTSAVRSSIENAIWLCQNCATLIDRDVSRFSATTLKKWKLEAEEKYQTDLENRYPLSSQELDPDLVAAEDDILLGAIAGHNGNMVIFGERNGWDTVTIIGENYSTNEFERSMYVQAMLNLLEEGLARRRGTDRAYELTFKGLKKAHALQDSGRQRRSPGQTQQF